MDSALIVLVPYTIINGVSLVNGDFGLTSRQMLNEIGSAFVVGNVSQGCREIRHRNMI